MTDNPLPQRLEQATEVFYNSCQEQYGHPDSAAHRVPNEQEKAQMDTLGEAVQILRGLSPVELKALAQRRVVAPSLVSGSFRNQLKASGYKTGG